MNFFLFFFIRATGVILAFILTSGCLSHPRVETVIHEGSEGTVFLKEFEDSEPHADHPVTLEPSLIRRVLLGVRIHERKTMMESTITGKAQATPAFTFSDIRFLTPHLISAFGQATSQEAVHFTVTGDVSGRRFDTGGVMFIKEDRLHFSLSEYGLTPERRSTLSQPTKSFDRPKRYSVTFTPISAVLNAEEDKHVVGDENDPKPLLISLNVLKRHTESVPEEEDEPSQSPTTTREEQSQEEMEQEIERLRKSMKEQEDRLKRLEQQME